MSRSKKSRKSTDTVYSTPKADKKLEPPKNKKPKKKTGKQAGNRQNEAKIKQDITSTDKQKKDPRIGNKTPIALGTTTPAESTNKMPSKKSSKKEKQSPIAAIRVVEPNDALEQELYAIEDDNQLQVILAKQEDEVTLNEQEVEYFNTKMARHQEISELLGLSDDEDEDNDDTAPAKHSENDLWEKLDNSDLSDY